MKALLSYSSFKFNAWITGSMKQVYSVIKKESHNGSKFKCAIVWDDDGRMLWHFKRDQDGSLVITDMATTHPVRHCYNKCQFRLIGGEIA